MASKCLIGPGQINSPLTYQKTTKMNSGQMKFFLLLLAAWLGVAADGAESRKKERNGKAHEVAPDVLEIGHLTHPRITESSGVVASRQYPRVFWTHNDGGGPKKQ